MPRWQALPEELDPQIRESAGRLRGLVDRSGLDLDAVADRTGYSVTSWEGYLNGRLLAPRGAVVALAEVTGTPQHHLTAGHGQGGPGPGGQATGAHGPGGYGSEWFGPDSQATGTHGPDGHGAEAYGPGGHGPGGHGAEAYRPGGHAAGAHGPGGFGAEAYGPDGHATDAHGPGDRDTARPPSVPHQRGSAPEAPGTPHGGRPAARSAGSRTPGFRSQGAMLAVGAVGALIVMAGAVLLAPGDDGAEATPPPSATPTAIAPELPAGVGCSGADCVGQDPEAMGCGGEFARTVAGAVVGGSKVEVRYSEVCAAAWARLTEAAVGDTVRITGSADGQDGEVMGDTAAYTPMVAVKKASDAKACATLTSGTKGCTGPGE
ncbi:XRE family transcriptional regulator [Streptomyces sp. MMBL 11-1]|uniref:XRE family transcriptional regulator n=1 Tax=Streptomyces sp. MMBL 11-1 TaxID=3026420 RepID=UPI002362D2D4|nr:XRE family transcriptional regulator [Streptomyces sp. MMBL 11-1]